MGSNSRRIAWHWLLFIDWLIDSGGSQLPSNSTHTLALYCLPYEGNQHTIRFELFLPKWLFSFLILARSRPAHQCPSSCKCDAQNRKQQLLRNTPRSCGVKNLLDDDYDSRCEITDFELVISSPVSKIFLMSFINHIETGHSFWDTNISA